VKATLVKRISSLKELRRKRFTVTLVQEENELHLFGSGEDGKLEATHE